MTSRQVLLIAAGLTHGSTAIALFSRSEVYPRRHLRVRAGEGKRASYVARSRLCPLPSRLRSRSRVAPCRGMGHVVLEPSLKE